MTIHANGAASSAGSWKRRRPCIQIPKRRRAPRRGGSSASGAVIGALGRVIDQTSSPACAGELSTSSGWLRGSVAAQVSPCLDPVILGHERRRRVVVLAVLLGGRPVVDLGEVRLVGRVHLVAMAGAE